MPTLDLTGLVKSFVAITEYLRLKTYKEKLWLGLEGEECSLDKCENLIFEFSLPQKAKYRTQAPLTSALRDVETGRLPGFWLPANLKNSKL